EGDEHRKFIIEEQEDEHLQVHQLQAGPATNRKVEATFHQEIFDPNHAKGEELLEKGNLSPQEVLDAYLLKWRAQANEPPRTAEHHDDEKKNFLRKAKREQGSTTGQASSSPLPRQKTENTPLKKAVEYQEAAQKVITELQEKVRKNWKVV
ncbi:unnamed protein product, partial [Amoebophrya sp. A25]